VEVQIQQNDERVKLSELIERIKVGMPTTLDDQESLRSRPLQTLEVDAKCGLWFSSPPIRQKSATSTRTSSMFL